MAYASPVAKRKRPSGAQTIGGILAGFDGQVFRTTRAARAGAEGDRLPSIPAGDGGTLIVELPDDAQPPDAEPQPAD